MSNALAIQRSSNGLTTAVGPLASLKLPEINTTAIKDGILKYTNKALEVAAGLYATQTGFEPGIVTTAAKQKVSEIIIDPFDKALDRLSGAHADVLKGLVRVVSVLPTNEYIKKLLKESGSKFNSAIIGKYQGMSHTELVEAYARIPVDVVKEADKIFNRNPLRPGLNLLTFLLIVTTFLACNPKKISITTDLITIIGDINENDTLKQIIQTEGATVVNFIDGDAGDAFKVLKDGKLVATKAVKAGSTAAVAVEVIGTGGSGDEGAINIQAIETVNTSPFLSGMPDEITVGERIGLSKTFTPNLPVTGVTIAGSDAGLFKITPLADGAFKFELKTPLIVWNSSGDPANPSENVPQAIFKTITLCYTMTDGTQIHENLRLNIYDSTLDGDDIEVNMIEGPFAQGSYKDSIGTAYTNYIMSIPQNINLDSTYIPAYANAVAIFDANGVDNFGASQNARTVIANLSNNFSTSGTDIAISYDNKNFTIDQSTIGKLVQSYRTQYLNKFNLAISSQVLFFGTAQHHTWAREQIIEIIEDSTKYATDQQSFTQSLKYGFQNLLNLTLIKNG